MTTKPQSRTSAPCGGKARVVWLKEHPYADAEPELAALSRVTGQFAHEFNNVLTIISSSAASVRVEDDDGAVVDIVEAVERGRTLVRQLMAFGERQALEPMVLDVFAHLEPLFGELEQSLPPDVELVVRHDGQDPSVRIDPTQLRIAVRALTENAVAAMPQGGRLAIDIEVVELGGIVASDPQATNPYVMIAVTDSGCGMSEATRRDACKPFFSTDTQRSGMGLATVYGIVRQSGGALRLDSELGAGTTAVVYLPQVHSASSDTTQSHEFRRATDRRVLLVDDDPPVRRALGRLLRLAGYDVIEADSGYEALQLVGTNTGKIDLVLTDVVMPGMTGIELARRLQATRAAPAILLTSGYAPPELHTQVLDLPFIQKPAGRDELLQAVAAVLGGQLRCRRGGLPEALDVAPRARTACA